MADAPVHGHMFAPSKMTVFNMVLFVESVFVCAPLTRQNMYIVMELAGQRNLQSFIDDPSELFVVPRYLR